MRMKDVIISVTGVQQGVNGPDAMELVTAGQYGQDEKETLLTWQESELTGMEGTTTVFQVEPEKVTLLRLGSVQSEMVFEEGRRHMSLYSTPYGNMEIGVRARRLNSTLELTGGRLEIDYDIEINHMLAGQSLFRIDVRENTPVKS